MKKISVVFFAVLLIFIFGSCSSNKMKPDDKYTMNASYSYGRDLEKQNISYEIIISGKENDINNIDSYEVLINTDYLVLDNVTNSSQSELGKTHYFKIIGDFTFNTKSETSKEEIGNMKILEGIKVIDKDKNEMILLLDED